VRASTPEDLYAAVCEAAVTQGKFVFAAVLGSDDGQHLHVLASAGEASERLRPTRIPIHTSPEEGQGFAAIAWRTQRTVVSNDVLDDRRAHRWHEEARTAGVGSAASVPVVLDAKTVCILGFHLKEVGAFDAETVKLLERIGENVAYALGNFARENERRAGERALRESEERFRALTELSSDWYWELDEELRFSRFDGQRKSGVAEALANRYLGKRPWETVLESDEGWDAFRGVCERHEPFSDFVSYRTLEDGTRRYSSVNGEPVFGADGRFRGYRGVGRDITERRRAVERIQHLATHDTLTGLPNRMMFSQLLGVAIETARRHERQLAVLFVDLDSFKGINDSQGHAAGDEVLRAVSARIRQSLRASDVVARLGGDEFVVLAQDVTGEDDAADVASRIVAATVRPVRVSGGECSVGASVGISLFPSDAVDEATLMKYADAAMYAAKQAGGRVFRFHV
jgi:diguanylate cyclase (GGDEF)-like protein/PAS domain S-box-containing protein